ncbi:MAG TPA: amylo-alpha-1,6-glucosidase [Candidatus Binatia bacterium]|nr:amylo-alpha-1,6-glucosidase [Candidatus Binatia bacterium]
MDDEVIYVRDQFYILSTSRRADDRTLVLKNNDTFAVLDRHGDAHAIGLGRQGVFHDGTRHLSRLETRFDSARLLLLGSTVAQSDGVLIAHLTNADMRHGDVVVVPRDTVHLLRTTFLWDGACHSRLEIRNYGSDPVAFVLAMFFGADFVDVFEVRGSRRAHRGTMLEPRLEPGCVTLGYEGLDRVRRTTAMRFRPDPSGLDAESARWSLTVPPRGEECVLLTIECRREEPSIAPTSNGAQRYDAALAEARARHSARTAWAARVETSNALFDEWWTRSSTDLAMMRTDLPTGEYPYAGVPWFSTPFGRDGLITAFQTLWLDPSLARGVLHFLAVTQATESRPEADAEPGKILHEARGGEMAALGEIPFGRYYGSVDSTPLFVMLAGAYWTRTGDRETVERVWPHVVRALDWIAQSGDLDGDGFVEYARRTPSGLRHQGWKDSEDSVFHADGALAEGAIALCEVQGYVYAAHVAAAELASVVGDAERAERHRRLAREMRDRFDDVFWDDEIGTYALALDGDKRPCRVRTSNAGHCLFSGIARAERSKAVATTLMHGDTFCGWGVRTVAASERRYNPMSYHNGSVWPHDNSVVAWGMSRYGLYEPVLAIFEGMFGAALGMDLRRLPELFCGFARRAGEGPTSYPMACAPQAWSAGAVSLLLQASLGLAIDAPARRIQLSQPRLPPFLDVVRLRDLRVGEASIDMQVVRHASDVGVTVTRRDGHVEVAVVT